MDEANIQPEGSLGWSQKPSLPSPLMMLCAEIIHSTLLLLPTSQKWQLGFWSFCSFLFIICPSCACIPVLFLAPYCFFVFIAGGALCSGVRIASKGPGSQSVSQRLTQVIFETLITPTTSHTCIEHPLYACD